MPGLLPDLECRDACPSRARREAGAQAAARVARRIEPCGRHPVAYDQGHGFAGESTDQDTPMSIDGPENGSVLDPRGAEPVFQRPDGAVNGSAKRDANFAREAVLVDVASAIERIISPLNPLKTIAIDCNCVRRRRTQSAGKLCPVG